MEATGPNPAAAAYREVIEAAVAQGLSAQRIWQDLKEDYGFGYGYPSVKQGQVLSFNLLAVVTSHGSPPDQEWTPVILSQSVDRW